MTTALAILGIIASLALLWTGVKRFAWATPLAALLSALDLLALTLAVVQLGWLGLALVVIANVVAFVGWGVAGAVYVDAQAASAAALGRMEKADVKQLLAGLDRDSRLTSLGPRRRAHLVNLLADRARNAVEIEQMVAPIGMLWIIGDKPDLGWLVERFDTVLRLYGEEAGQAMSVADVLTAGTQQSAATLREMLEASVVAGGGSAAAPTN